jgi:glycosyltransferase involved in cell wall biosynthesis
MEIHQLSAGFAPGDAISSHALALRDLLRSWGHTSHIYARYVENAVAHECRPIEAFLPGPDSIAIYHYSIGAEEVSSRFLRSPGKRILIYHNITPHTFFAPYSPAQYELTRKGRAALKDLSDRVDLAVGDSAFNCAELAENGFRNPRVLPLLLDLDGLTRTAPSRLTLRRYEDDWTNVLFVGRIAPNKRQDDVIGAFAHYNRRINRRSRLFLVGHWQGMENYLADLREEVRDAGVADHVVFTGSVDRATLAALYRLADVFVCLSEHEGFCVPLLEAFHFDVPVLAYAAAAVPDTMGDAGVLVTRKDYPVLAEVVHLLASDAWLRTRVLRRQHERLDDFRPGRVAAQFQQCIADVLAA